jgi:uncharacterized Rmd1/YagE family protein
MSRTKAQLEAQLKTAQSLVVSHQATIKAQSVKLAEMEQTHRNQVAEIKQQYYKLHGELDEHKRRLIRRAGKVDALQDLVMVMARVNVPERKTIYREE